MVVDYPYHIAMYMLADGRAMHIEEYEKAKAAHAESLQAEPEPAKKPKRKPAAKRRSKKS